ncbi:receptor kinase-like protein Xa21 [Triticum dicoccoides]|uniref:receptor kinase-like protein Xa21 n=1 Tax=Triticum dicoccoides TaxID=85692 RepID=UPI00188F1095|nr:receptor kinase-like protein Xa21 [Triticum dicoccoides]
MARVLAFFCFFSLSCICSHARLPPSPRSSNAAADELALLSFKSMLSSRLLDSWNTSSHYCSWPGVACGRRHPHRVISLHTGSFNLSGHISPFLGNLSFLRELDLRDNQLIGQVPPELGRLGRLQLLNFSANFLQGEIPTEIGALKNLYILNLQENGFSGGIPHSLADLPLLEFLFLSNNRLFGEIPSSLGNLSLMHLDLMGNNLSGPIPPSLGMMSSLSWLSLGYNNLSGPIPVSIWNISSLMGLSVEHNMLGGTIPSDAFSSLSYLEFILMDNNLFHGRLPASVANVTNVKRLQFGPNFFSGTVPADLGRLGYLLSLELSSTSLEAKEPNDWEFITALTNCSQLQNLELGSSKFGGVLPSSVSNLSTSLKRLDLQSNTISGNIPKDIGNLANLEYLVLDSNSFRGTLPSTFGRLNKLQLFSVENNKISGSIPLTFGNLTELISLELQANAFSGNIPSTLGNLTKLLTLNLASNKFSGQIPIAVFNISTLSLILDLSYNNFEGSIPQEIGHLKNLVEFHAESNMLSGEIPVGLGECQLLQNIYIQNNFLNGTIPSLLSQLKGLQNLDFSNNNLSGLIPSFLGNLSTLYQLNLSFNSFAGQVPTFGVFANSSAISIENNGKLCGGIATLHLPPCSLDIPKKRHRFLIIPISLSLVTTIVVLALLCKLCIVHKKSKQKIPSTTSRQDLPMISYLQLAKATDGFSSTNLIGSGSFGSVYKGVIDDQAEESINLVAVKVLKVHTPGALKSFIAECEALRNVRHRNLVKIITACPSNDNKGNDFKAIVFDFMPNGSLDVWLHPYTNEQTEHMYLDLLQRVTILLDVAYALDYLHCQGPAPVVHCDLKPSNVLLDADMVAHVGDFGLARILVDESSLCQHSSSSMGLRGTIGYAAPEYGAGNMVSTHGDIYSFGILVLETVTAKRPTDSRFGQGLGLCEYVELALHNNSVMGVVDSRLPLDLKSDHQTVDYHSNKRNVDCLVSVLRLGISCSQESPSSRMPTRGIIKELKAIKESLSTQ